MVLFEPLRGRCQHRATPGAREAGHRVVYYTLLTVTYLYLYRSLYLFTCVTELLYLLILVALETVNNDRGSNLNLFCNEARQIQNAGYWSSDDICDIIPLVISNVLERPITIYTSRPEQAIIKVAIDNDIQQFGMLYLALTSQPGHEHYEICIPKPSTDSDSGTNKTPMSYCCMSCVRA